MLYVAIDPGKNTGMAWAQDRQYLGLETLLIHKAFELFHELYAQHDLITVVVEDARKRGCAFKAFEKAQGAGSVKRDSRIWQDFLNDFDSKRVSTIFVAPGVASTKMDAKPFEKLTGWTKRTSNHSRDAALLIYSLARIRQPR